jgi:pimeloyl-ACP methyl ester carboxylesterase
MRTVEEFAAALGALLRQQVAAPADVVGNSFGTQIALALAESEPDAVRRLVLIGPTIDRAARSYSKVLARWLRTAPIEPPSLSVSLARSYLKCGLRTPALAFRASMRDRPEQRISKLSQPILLVRGVRDSIAPRAWLEELQRNAARAEIAEVPNTAHTVDYAAPKQVAPIVTEFLDRA